MNLVIVADGTKHFESDLRVEFLPGLGGLLLNPLGDFRIDASLLCNGRENGFEIGSGFGCAHVVYCQSFYGRINLRSKLGKPNLH